MDELIDISADFMKRIFNHLKIYSFFPSTIPLVQKFILLIT